jgi:hypothetical protein
MKKVTVFFYDCEKRYRSHSITYTTVPKDVYSLLTTAKMPSAIVLINESGDAIYCCGDIISIDIDEIIDGGK